MKKLLLALAVVMMMVLVAAPAQASILAKHLTFDGLEDRFEDDSRAEIIDNGDFELGVGDTIYGYVSISDTDPLGDPSPDEIAFLYAFDVTGTTTSHEGIPYLTHSAPAAGLASFLDPAFPPKQTILTPGNATVADATIVVLANTGTRDPLLPEIADLGDLTGFIPADGWVYQATLGFDPGSADFLHLEDSVSGSRSERGGFTILDHNMGINTAFLGVSVTWFADINPLDLLFSPSSTHDAVLQGLVTNSDPFPPPGPGWSFEDSSDFRINAIPEPSSILIWGAIGGLGLFWARRRKKTA